MVQFQGFMVLINCLFLLISKVIKNEVIIRRIFIQRSPVAKSLYSFYFRSLGQIVYAIHNYGVSFN